MCSESKHHPYASLLTQAAMGIAHLLVMALEKEGVPKAEAIRKIWMVDSKGLIVKVLFRAEKLEVSSQLAKN